MESKYIAVFAMLFIVATILTVPSDCSPVNAEHQPMEVTFTRLAPTQLRRGRQYFGYPMGGMGMGGATASASASASASSGGMGYGGYPMYGYGMYGKK